MVCACEYAEYAHIHTHRQTGRRAGSQTDRQPDVQTDIQKDIHTQKTFRLQKCIRIILYVQIVLRGLSRVMRSVAEVPIYGLI